MYIPPEDLSHQDLFNLQNVPISTGPQGYMDVDLHREAFSIAQKYSEDQLLSHNMVPMLSDMGTNFRAMLYRHALSREGLDSTPLRDMLTQLDPIINQVIEHAWLQPVNYSQVKEFIGDHPSLAEKYPVRALTLSEWSGMKIWQIATIPPVTGAVTAPITWKYSQAGVNYMQDITPQEAEKSKTPRHAGKGKGDQKGKGSGKKGKKPVKVIGTPEAEDPDRVGKRYFPGPATLPEAWRERRVRN